MLLHATAHSGHCGVDLAWVRYMDTAGRSPPKTLQDFEASGTDPCTNLAKLLA